MVIFASASSFRLARVTVPRSIEVRYRNQLVTELPAGSWKLEATHRQNNEYLCASGSTRAGSAVRISPSAMTV